MKRVLVRAVRDAVLRRVTGKTNYGAEMPPTMFPPGRIKPAAPHADTKRYDRAVAQQDDLERRAVETEGRRAKRYRALSETESPYAKEAAGRADAAEAEQLRLRQRVSARDQAGKNRAAAEREWEYRARMSPEYLARKRAILSERYGEKWTVIEKRKRVQRAKAIDRGETPITREEYEAASWEAMEALRSARRSVRER